jgi:hypothetical protein
MAFEEFSNKYPVGHEGDDRYLPYGINPDGKTESELQAARDAAIAKTNQETLNRTGNPGKAGQTTYAPVGSADVGGGVGGGKIIEDFFKAGEKENDAAQAGNRSAMLGSLANMKEDRGTVVPENAQLLGREANSRVQQGNALDLARDAAAGNAPSAAAYRTQAGMDSVMAGQSAAGGAARGLGALTGTQTTGASAAGLAAGNTAVQGGMARSAEIGEAMGMYGSQAGDMRQGDLGRVNQSNQNALANQSLNDDWRLGNAKLAASQGQLGVSQGQMDDAYYGASQVPKGKQLGYDQEMNAIQAGASADSAAAHRAKANADADRNRQLGGAAVQGGLTIGGTALGGPIGGALGSAGGGMANSYISGRK